MNESALLTFGRFRLDPYTSRLWQGDQCLSLRPRAVAVLLYLMERADQTISETELLAHVWNGSHVSRAVVKVCIREIRAALGETAAAPHYIETTRGQGYRFCNGGSMTAEASTPAGPHVPIVVGREQEIGILSQRLAGAMGGERQLIFLAGEAGIGKTTVVDAFCTGVVQRDKLWLARGQCTAHYGAHDAYLPLLEALSRLGQGADGKRVIDALRQYAPTCLIHLPALLSEAEREQLQPLVEGATRTLMLRQLAEALEHLTTERPLVLVLEDLHWNDPSTIDFLAYWSQRQDSAKLLVLGTYRPFETRLQTHPLLHLTNELQTRDHVTELHLNPLREGGVRAYTSARLGGTAAPDLVGWLYRRTEGHPLYLVRLCDHLIQQGMIERHDEQWTLGQVDQAAVPTEMRRLIENQFEALSAECQQALEVGSVIGEHFSAAAVSLGLQQALDEVERQCEGMARMGHFVSEAGVVHWPDGTVSGSYQFQHAFLQQLIHDRVGSARRVNLHRRIGQGLEQTHDPHTDPIAGLLAYHFIQGQDSARAIRYSHRAAVIGLRRAAFQEVIEHCQTALTLLPHLPDAHERNQTELGIQLTLLQAMLEYKGWSAPEAEIACRRALAICPRGEDPERRFTVLAALRGFHHVRAEYGVTQDLGEQLLSLSQDTQRPDHTVFAYAALSEDAIVRGHFRDARVYAQVAIDTCQRHRLTFPQNTDPIVHSYRWLAQAVGKLGYLDQALTWSEENIVRAHTLNHPFNLAFALAGAVYVFFLLQEAARTCEAAEALIDFAESKGFSFWRAVGTLFRGWALSRQDRRAEGLQLFEQGLAAYRATGCRAGLPHMMALHGELYGRIGHLQKGLAALRDAFALTDASNDRRSETKLYQIYGDLFVLGGRLPEAEATFERGIEIARRQEAKTSELEAATSLGRLWEQQGRGEEARALLTPLYNGFTEGFETPLLQEAREVLETL